jgi:hypothetical protein
MPINLPALQRFVSVSFIRISLFSLAVPVFLSLLPCNPFSYPSKPAKIPQKAMASRPRRSPSPRRRKAMAIPKLF